MSNFIQINKVILPREIIEEIFDFLRTVGDDGYEAVGLFTGRSNNSKFNIMQVYIPKQYTYKTDQGLMYKVDGDELNILYDWLFDHQQSLFAQIHTHPTHAYHSEADDRNCIVTKTGGLSIVIPNFARDAINIDNWAVYRLVKGKGWKELDRKEVQQLINIV